MSKQLDSILTKRPDAVVEPDKNKPSEVSKPVPAVTQPSIATTVAPETDTLETFVPEDDAPLGVMVPASVKQALNVKSAMEGKTNRQLVLTGLKSVGIDVPEHELRDKRKPDAA